MILLRLIESLGCILLLINRLLIILLLWLKIVLLGWLLLGERLILLVHIHKVGIRIEIEGDSHTVESRSHFVNDHTSEH